LPTTCKPVEEPASPPLPEVEPLLLAPDPLPEVEPLLAPDPLPALEPLLAPDPLPALESLPESISPRSV
jgi:hypothetical protein